MTIPGSCGHCKYYDPVLDVCFLPNHVKCKNEVRIISPVMCPKCLWFDSSTASCSRDCVCPFVRSLEDRYKYHFDFKPPPRFQLTWGGDSID